MNIRFEELLERWQEGEASGAELAELESLLRRDGTCRRALAGSVLLESDLHRRRGEVVPEARPLRRGRSLEAAAAILVVAASVGSVAYLFFKEKGKTPSPLPEVVQIPVPPLPRTDLPEGAKFSLDEAADKAVSVAPGMVVEAAFEEDDGRLVFSVTIAQEGRIREIDLDPETGAILEDEAEPSDLARRISDAKTPLKEAIRAVMATSPGYAEGARLVSRQGKTWIEVDMRYKGGRNRVSVDAITGKVQD